MKLKPFLLGGLKVLGGLLLVLILLVAGVVAYFGGTQSGTQKLLGLAKGSVPGALDWSSISGTLFGPLQIDSLSYEQVGGMVVRLGETDFDWKPSSLFSRTLNVERLHLKGLEIHLPKPTETPPSAEPVQLPQIRLPFAIRAQDLDLTNIKIFPYGSETPIEVERLGLQASGEDALFQVLEFVAKAPQGEARLTGTLQPVEAYPMDLALSWTFKDQKRGNYAGKGTFVGDLDRLQLVHEVSGAVNASLKGELTDLLRQPAWDATLTLDSKDLGRFAPALAGSPLNGVLRSSGSVPDFSATATIDTSLTQTGPLQAVAHIHGSPEQLTINKLHLNPLDHPGKVDLAGTVDLSTLRAELKADWEAMGWPLTSASQYLSPQGRLEFKGSAEDFAATLVADLDGDMLIPASVSADVSGGTRRINIKSIKLDARDASTRLMMNGEVDLESQRVDAKGRWTELAWPMQGPAQYASPKGEFSAQGSVKDFSFDLAAAVSGLGIPSGDWTLEGKGNEAGLPSFEIEGKTLDGRISGTGSARWSPGVSWDVALDADGINPGKQWPEAEGDINAALTSKGELTPQGPNLTAVIEKLTGRFRGQSLSGGGEVSLSGPDLTISQLEVRNGVSTVKANGELGDIRNLEWQVLAPDMSQLWVGLGGNLSAAGTLKGTSAKPIVDLSLSGDSLKFNEINLKRLQGEVKLDVGGGQQSMVELQGTGLKIAGQTWDALSVKGGGDPATHQLALSLNGKPAQISASVKGGLDASTWRGTLASLSIDKTLVGEWSLARPAQLVFSETRFDVEPVCLDGNPGTLCVDAQRDPSSGLRAHLTVDDIAPARFAEFLPPGMKWDTDVAGSASFQQSPGGAMTAKADFSIPAGMLSMEQDGDPVTIEMGKSVVTASLENDVFDSRSVLSFGALGELIANVTMDQVSTSPTINGTLTGGVSDLGSIAVFAPQLSQVQGKLVTDLVFAGPLARPEVTGKFEIVDLVAEVPNANIKLEDTYLKANSEAGSGLKIEGFARSGGGELSLGGGIATGRNELVLTIKGETFSVSNSSTLKAVITPDLKVNMTSAGMSVTGSVKVPSAYFNAKGGSGASTISPSGDVVLVNADGVVKDSSPVSALNLNVKVELGDDIKVEAGEFNGALKGSLQIDQKPELAPRGTGTIEVVDGEYVVYGQQLQVQRGRILFSGGPIDNPKLDLEVARNVEAYDVVAGARVGGSAQSPLLQLYSEPSMPDASILSYMLLGQPPGTKGGSYTLGKFLTPDLYVSYGIGLFNAINTFNLRYKLTDKLSLQAASGAASSADLIYNIER